MGADTSSCHTSGLQHIHSFPGFADTALLCGVSFLWLWAEPTQINRPVYCGCGQNTSAGHSARESSPGPVLFRHEDMPLLLLGGKGQFPAAENPCLWSLIRFSVPSPTVVLSLEAQELVTESWSGLSLFIHQHLLTGLANKLHGKERGDVRPVIITACFHYLDTLLWGCEHLPAS